MEPTPVVAQTKALSKKELKKREMEELEALLGVTPVVVAAETKPAEKKPEASGVQAESESKKKKKNKNKKEGGAETEVAAAATTAAAVEEKKEEVVVELTPEQKEAALKEALKKRTAG